MNELEFKRRQESGDKLLLPSENLSNFTFSQETERADLRDGNFRDTNFTRAAFIGTDLTGAIMADANFTEAYFENTPLRDVQGIESATFNGANIDQESLKGLPDQVLDRLMTTAIIQKPKEEEQVRNFEDGLTHPVFVSRDNLKKLQEQRERARQQEIDRKEADLAQKILEGMGRRDPSKQQVRSYLGRMSEIHPDDEGVKKLAKDFSEDGDKALDRLIWLSRYKEVCEAKEKLKEKGFGKEEKKEDKKSASSWLEGLKEKAEWLKNNILDSGFDPEKRQEANKRISDFQRMATNALEASRGLGI